jgi:hypothetical protein
LPVLQLVSQLKFPLKFGNLDFEDGLPGNISAFNAQARKFFHGKIQKLNQHFFVGKPVFILFRQAIIIFC